MQGSVLATYRQNSNIGIAGIRAVHPRQYSRQQPQRREAIFTNKSCTTILFLKHYPYLEGETRFLLI